MEPSKHTTNEPRIPSVEPNNTEASSSSAASQTSAPPTAHSVSEATSSSDTSPVESRPPSKPECATADPAPPCPQFNPEDWSAPIAHTYTGTTVLSFPDDMHTVTIQGARFLTHIYTCPVGDLDWDKAIANMLQWCSFEQHRRAPSSQGHPPPIHGLLKCPPIIQIFTSLHPSTFPTIPPKLTSTGQFVRYQPARKSQFHIPHDLRELPGLYHGIIQHEEPDDDSVEDVPNLSWLFVEQYAPKKWRWYLNRRAVWEATRPRLSEEQMEIW
ncbi:uncharacterized protein BO66DRAFT_396712 [Aspergillus aculeatinus CBS 121060]|uniref:Uncharacterized protein n=1 Tax=Aspergillus aculeatinus CBS 121060 TaxID=1448322 RepID=A0ACD1GR34_9EURO|nr:hypothetical protein BO66DRAFT_396712 [Aspergillus aculeatinus CBS 121060]RAH63772.1 hypothetical protein BO66DRAFT_396712 [Aspergillus aculeatinus CBS 121060]